MNFDENNDPAWQLLGRARKAEARPDFAASVLEAVRNEPQVWEEPASAAPVASETGKIVAFPGRRRWLLPAILGAAAAIALGVFAWLKFGAQGTDGTNGSNDIVEVTPAQENTTTDLTKMIDDSLEQELVAVDGISSLIEAQDVSELSDADLVALLN